MIVPLIRAVRDKNNAQHDVLCGPCACGAYHRSDSDYFHKLEIQEQAVVLETRRQTVALPPIENSKVVETAATNGDEHASGLTFKVQVFASQPAVILSYNPGHAPADGPYLGDNNFTGLPEKIEPGIYEIAADYDFHQGYSEGHRADGESSWEYTVTSVRKLEECLSRVFLDSGAIAILCRKEKDHPDSVHEATLPGDVAELTKLTRVDVTITWEDNG